MLKDKKDLFVSINKLGKQTVALAMIASVAPPLDKGMAMLKVAKNQEEKENIVLDSLALAHTNAIQVMTDPKAAMLAAAREEMSEEKAKLAMMRVQRLKAMETLQALRRPRVVEMERPMEMVPVMV